MGADKGFYVVITGANSGLGLAIGCRLIDEFLTTRHTSESLYLITTTRDTQKAIATVKHLRDHLIKLSRKLERGASDSSSLLQQRVHFIAELVDLTNLVSVQEFSSRLRKTLPRIDALVCNAGIGGWDDLYWGRAVWTVLTNWKNAVTWPTYKKSGQGWVTKPQIPGPNKSRKSDEPPLGRVFAANFFGHYLIGHYLAPLLARHNPKEARGRIIWTSSLEGYSHSLDLNDIQAIGSTEPYESTKRQTDVMGIASTLPSAAPLVDQYFDHARDTEETATPRIYVAHPGICGTTIFQLSAFLEYCMLIAFYVARWLGSQWHPITCYKGAVATVWLVLAKQSMLDTMERTEGVSKWGSATDWLGRERVERTEVEGWGWGGRIGEWTNRKGRSPHAKELSEHSKQNFEDTGRYCWEEMEKLRIDWEKRLDAAGLGIKMD